MKYCAFARLVNSDLYSHDILCDPHDMRVSSFCVTCTLQFVLIFDSLIIKLYIHIHIINKSNKYNIYNLLCLKAYVPHGQQDHLPQKQSLPLFMSLFFLADHHHGLIFVTLEKRAPLSISFLSCGILHKIAGNKEKVFEINNFWRVKKTWQ